MYWAFKKGDDDWMTIKILGITTNNKCPDLNCVDLYNVHCALQIIECDIEGCEAEQLNSPVLLIINYNAGVRFKQHQHPVHESQFNSSIRANVMNPCRHVLKFATSE